MLVIKDLEKIYKGTDKGISGISLHVEKGDIYARKEVTNPTRIVTSTVVIKGGNKERLPVKTKNDIPKDKIFDVMKDIDAVTVDAPKKIGDVIIDNVAGTGVAVIATRNVEIE